MLAEDNDTKPNALADLTKGKLAITVPGDAFRELAYSAPAADDIISLAVTDDGVLLMEACNQMRYVKHSIAGTGHVSGKVHITGANLETLLRCHEGSVHVFAKGASLLVAGGQLQARVPIVSGSVNRPQPGMPLGSIALDFGQIQEPIRKVARVAWGSGSGNGGGITPYDFNCIQMISEPHRLSVYGADRRLFARASLMKASPFVGSFLLPRKAVDVITAFRSPSAEAVLEFFERAVGVMFHDGVRSVHLMIMEYVGQFPNCAGNEVSSGVTSLTAPGPELVGLLDMARRHAKRLDIDLVRDRVEQSVTFTSRNEDGGGVVKASPRFSWQGEDVRRLGVNAKSLYQAVSAAGDGEVTILLNGKDGKVGVVVADGSFNATIAPYSPAEER